MIAASRYECQLALTSSEIQAAQELRFEVFNMEMDEGFDHSYLTRLDRDRFDPVCEHLIVKDLESDKIIGTYRLQTGANAKDNLGYYSEQEFDFLVYEPWRERILELGRACIHHDHRNHLVLNLLWKQIAQFAQEHRLRFLIGCSSLTSQNPELGLRTYDYLAYRHLAPPELQTVPKPEFECLPQSSPRSRPELKVNIPKLLGAYLRLGATICGPPAIDRKFKTIDFLTLLDLDSLAPRIRKRYLS